MSKVINIAELEDNVSENNIIFGGTFDPFHTGHVSVVCALLKKFKRVIIAPTSGNPWKEEKPTALLHRLEIAKLILKAEGITEIQFSDFPYKYTEELVLDLRTRGLKEIYWAIGEDSKDSVTKWRNWNSLNITVVTVPITIPTHAIDVRTKKTSIHPAAAEYVNSNNLY